MRFMTFFISAADTQPMKRLKKKRRRGRKRRTTKVYVVDESKDMMWTIMTLKVVCILSFSY